MQSDRDYILLYRTLVEKKFLLGVQGKLKQRELEYVGQLIEEKSRVKLSISTLKRLWRNDVSQLPHPSTLDALVSILDYKDWQDFKKRNAVQFEKNVSHAREHKKKKLIRPLPVVLISSAVVLTGLFIMLPGFNKKEGGVNVKGEVNFKADKAVSVGVPNTVKFYYDLSAVQADSFFIQQSWNPRDRVRIDQANNYYSAIYYTPGFHFARIMANDSILKFVNVHIKTDGWLPLVKYDIREKRHFYLDPDAVISNGAIRATRQILQHANVDTRMDFFLRYYNVRDFEGVNSNDFDLETKFRCEKLSETDAMVVPCPQIELMLITEQNVFFIPVTSKGCVGELELLVGEVYKGGKDNDLSALGTDPYEWQTLRIKNQNKHTAIFLNGSLAHELEYKQDFGDIKGLIYTFTGSGAIDYVRIQDEDGKLVYADDF
jgi:hypothetical protein